MKTSTKGNSAAAAPGPRATGAHMGGVAGALRRGGKRMGGGVGAKGGKGSKTKWSIMGRA